MCGIAGIVSLDQSPLEEPGHAPVLRAMLGRMASRGPDDEQLRFWQNVGLGYRRLSIVDLAGGRQPMANEDGTLWVITNGEIYNHADLKRELTSSHTFASRSDCEVQLHLYEEQGADFVSRLNGMFATALLDQRRKRLYLLRDRLGIKPLYYYQDQRRLVFASEVKALLAHPDVPREVDWRAALENAETRWYGWSGQELPTFFRGIRQLPGGHLLEIELDTGTVRVREYWNPARAAAEIEPLATGEAYVEAYRDLLADSVRLRLMADVEYGLFLSGGIDSVSIARLASKHASFHTFSVLSQSTLGNGDAQYGHLAAQLFGLPNHQVHFDWRELEIQPTEWKRVLWDCETHLAGPEQIYKYNLHSFARQCRPDLKVILLGQGSDEFNGGYSMQRNFNRASDPDWATFLETLRWRQRAVWFHLGLCRNPYLDVKPTSWLRDTGVDDPRNRGLAGPIVFNERYLAELAGQDAAAHPWHGYRDLYRSMMQVYQLWHEDRTAAANSVENRVPFLDHRLVELLYSVPPKLYEELFWDKAILRRAMADELPGELAQRPKVPFFHGEDARYTLRLVYRMLRADGDALVEEAIAASDAADGVLDGDVLRQVMAELPDDPNYTTAEALLSLVNLGLLSSMAREEPSLPTAELRVSEVEISGENVWEEQFSASMVRRIESLAASSIPRFGKNVLLVECKTGDPDWIDEGCHYLLVGTEIRYVLNPDLDAWVGFLQKVDGNSSVKDILTATKLREADVWKHLEEAVEQGVLDFSER